MNNLSINPSVVSLVSSDIKRLGVSSLDYLKSLQAEILGETKQSPSFSGYSQVVNGITITCHPISSARMQKILEENYGLSEGIERLGSWEQLYMEGKGLFDEY